jgi:hypothetical protein
VWSADTTARAQKSFELSGAAAIVEELLSIHRAINECRGCVAVSVPTGIECEHRSGGIPACAVLPHKIAAAPLLLLLLFRMLTAMYGFVQHGRQFLALRQCRAVGGRRLRCVRNRMIEDLLTSADTCAQFPVPPGRAEFSCILMTDDAWPPFPSIALGLPHEVIDAEERFAALFKQRQPTNDSTKSSSA